MNKMLNICVLSHSFPTSKTIDFVFVEQLCKSLADKNVSITVIAPQSVTKCLLRGIPLTPKKTYFYSDEGNKILLYRPYWYSFGSRFKNLMNYGRISFNHAIDKTLRRINQKFDVIYCHFWDQAVASFSYAVQNNIPQIVVAGEGVITAHLALSTAEINRIKNYINGVICVSTKSKNESISAGFTDGSNCKVIPNAIDPKLFHQIDKYVIRKKLGFSNDDFIVAFVGQFNERKGVLRLSEALGKLNNSNIKAMFIGTGKEIPTYKHTLFIGTVMHDNLADYLSAADVFVLPTTNEGCCNAIIEAMACGLPILSSDMEFNHDVLDKSNSILFNPYDIGTISEAINYIYLDKNKCKELSLGSLEKVKSLTLDERANKIKLYLESCIKN